MHPLGKNPDLYRNINDRSCWLARHSRKVLAVAMAFFVVVSVASFAGKAIPQAAHDAVNHEVMQ